jgi:NAD(P)-dependent dehydrogenase (short-subunit alcohol dehydrogenase family)
MDLVGKVAVVTGGGNGIGAALCRAIADRGARAVVIVDVDGTAAERVAADTGGHPIQADAAVAADVERVVGQTIARHGAVDVFCSNAGIGGSGGVEAPDEQWQQLWSVNVMAHVYAARAVLPSMLTRGEGYLLNTASASGLLTNLGNAPYTATKHAAVGFAEWLAITYGDRGIGVSCLCPMGVDTDFLRPWQGRLDGASVAVERIITPDEVARAAVAGIAAEQFLILPHPEVADYERYRATDRQRWLAGMRATQATLVAELT